jgi:hypothetical protein
MSWRAVAITLTAKFSAYEQAGPDEADVLRLRSQWL